MFRRDSVAFRKVAKRISLRIEQCLGFSPGEKRRAIAVAEFVRTDLRQVMLAAMAAALLGRNLEPSLPLFRAPGLIFVKSSGKDGIARRTVVRASSRDEFVAPDQSFVRRLFTTKMCQSVPEYRDSDELSSIDLTAGSSH